MWMNDLWHKDKVIIGMLHLDALPGDPRYTASDSLDIIVEHARMDLKSLIDGGVDAILISNEFSFPYQRKMDYVTVACMARIIGELKKDIIVPFGVDAISDGTATLELARAVDADFCRGTFSGVYVGDGGFYNNDISKLLRRKTELHLANLKMLYFINPESDKNLDTRELAEIAKSTVFKTGADGLCISASAAGQDVNENLIQCVKDACPNVAVLANTGCRPETIESKLKYADAAVVGTYFKKDGKLQDSNGNNLRVDVNRVKEFMDVVNRIRKE